MTGPMLLTVDDCAKTLRIGRRLTYELVMNGKLPSVKLGRCRRVAATELEKFVARLVEEGNLEIGTR